MIMSEQIRIEIDPMKLDTECLYQVTLRRDIGQDVAQTQLSLDEAKSKKDLITAELDRSIRSNPEKFGIKKPTETSIANAIKETRDYQQIDKEVNLTKYQLAMSKAVEEAVIDRKRSLTLLIELLQLDYFSDPTHSIKDKQEIRTRAIRRRTE